MASRSAYQARSFSKNSAAKRSGKKPLPEPTHIGHFISILIISACKRILHVDTAVKIGVYLCGVLVGSVFSDVFMLPRSYFSDKKNVLNRIFVSFGFGWTFILLGTFVSLTSFVFTCGNWKLVLRKHLIRLGIAALWWYCLTRTFSYVDSVVGACSISSHKQKQSCLRAGKAWLGFDISGHVFLLIHNLLTISEEVKSFKFWTTLDLLLNKEEDLESKRNVTAQEISQARFSFKYLTPYIKVIIVLLTVWTIFCEFMLIISVIYRFHTLTQKVTAAFVAVGCWFVTYNLLCQTKADLLPAQPGECSLDYMKKPIKQG